MNCKRIENKIPDLIAGHISGTGEREIRTHLDSCAPCRAFHESVISLYAIGEPTPSLGSPSDHMRPQRWSDSLRERPLLPIGSAAAVILVLIGLLASSQFPRTSDRLSPTEASSTALAFLPISLDVPSYPRVFGGGVWYSNREEATELARFTGKPMLEEFSFGLCPRCQYMERVLDQPEQQPLLGGYICFRELLPDNGVGPTPAWVTDNKPKGTLYQLLPAIRISDGTQHTDPIWEVMSMESIHALTDDWEEVRADYAGGPRQPLDETQFDSIVHALDGIPELIDRGDVKGATEALASILELQDSHHTAFVEVAVALQGQLRDALVREIERIRTLHKGAPPQVRQAQDLSRRLLPHVAGTDLEKQLATASTR